MKGTTREFKLEGEDRKGETEVLSGATFMSRFDIDEIMQIGWCRFMVGIVSNRYDFELYALFDIKHMK